MRSRLTWTGLVLVLVTLVGLGWWRSRERSDDALGLSPLAEVGGRTLTVGRFNRSFVEYLLATGRNDTPTERYRHLDRLIRTMVLADEARTLGLDRSDEYASLVDRNRRLAVGAEYFDVAFAASQPPLTEKESREAFRNSRERVAVRHLFYRDPAEARAAYEAIRAGTDFMELARALYGTEPDDSLAGFLGFAAYWDLDDAVADVAFDLPVGSLSEPVRSRYGWHVLRVEDRLSNPILTESDYQMHRAGIEGRELLRRNRLAGDAFIREMMEALDVRVDDDGARAIVAAIRDATVVPPERQVDDANQRAQVRITQGEIEKVRGALAPETVLATLELDGRRVDFTAGDFIRWLPELPYAEVRDRTVSAVGRALRNEVLAFYGQKEGLEDRPLVQEAIRFNADVWLADQMRQALRVSGRVRPTDDEVAAGFTELGFRKLEVARADYWMIRFRTIGEADSAAARIRSGQDASRFVGYVLREDEDVRGDGIAGHVRRAPLDRTMTGCLSDEDCFVLHVTRRELEYTRLEDKAAEIRALLERVLPEERMTDSLLTVRPVEVDTLLFRRMMEEVSSDNS